MLMKAYSVLTIKSVDTGRRVISGMATTPEVDRSGDIVDPMGAKFASSIPLLLFHDSQLPVGRVKLGKPTKAGIPFEASIPNVEEAGKFKDRVDEAWHSVKYGAISAVSIGFRPVEDAIERIQSGLKFLAYEILELSLVPIPANASATIQNIKSLDEANRASPGRALRLPGVSGETGRTANSNRQKGHIVKTLQQLREERETKAARLNELKSKMSDTSQDFSDEEADEVDDILTEIKSLDRDILSKRIELADAGTAKSVDGRSSEGAARSRTARDNPVTKSDAKEDEFEGQSFARLVKARGLSFIKGMPLTAAAEHLYGKSGAMLVKTGVPGGGTGSGEWGSELVGIDNRYTGDFVEYLYGRTGFDQLGLREAPRNVSVKGMDGAAAGYWTGESKSIKVSAPSASATDLVPRKVAGMCVMSRELMEDSSPGADMLVRDALAEALALRVDSTFFSADAASAGVSPAGILNGVSAVATTGGDAAGLRTLINGLYSGFITGKNVGGLVLVMHPAQAKALGLLVNALGQTEFPGLGATGGTLLGDRVVVTDNIDPSTIILLKPSDIWRIGDTGVDIAMSREAMIEQDTAPTGASDTPVAASATMVSMFGTDSIAIRATRRVGWALRRSGVVAFTDTADFGAVAS